MQKPTESLVSTILNLFICLSSLHVYSFPHIATIHVPCIAAILTFQKVWQSALCFILAYMSTRPSEGPGHPCVDSCLPQVRLLFLYLTVGVVAWPAREMETVRGRKNLVFLFNPSVFFYTYLFVVANAAFFRLCKIPISELPTLPLRRNLSSLSCMAGEKVSP